MHGHGMDRALGSAAEKYQKRHFRLLTHFEPVPITRPSLMTAAPKDAKD
jgi:hypothetical protein